MSLPSMFTLPTELLTVLFSAVGSAQGRLDGPMTLGESSAILPTDILRPGMLTAR